MPKDYYFILGAHPDASYDQIELAYRERLRTLHPGDFEKNREFFIEVQEAYTILHDPATREAYDRLRRSRPAGTPERFPQGSPSSDEEAIDLRSFQKFLPSQEELFQRIWDNFTEITRPKAEKIESLNCEIILTPEEALRGGRVTLKVPARIPCPVCKGKGGVGPLECWRCNTKGFVVEEFPLQLSYPPGTTNHVVEVSLDGLGIHNLYLTAYFRVSDTA